MIFPPGDRDSSYLLSNAHHLLSQIYCSFIWENYLKGFLEVSVVRWLRTCIDAALGLACIRNPALSLTKAGRYVYMCMNIHWYLTDVCSNPKYIHNCWMTLKKPLNISDSRGGGNLGKFYWRAGYWGETTAVKTAKNVRILRKDRY